VCVIICCAEYCDVAVATRSLKCVGNVCAVIKRNPSLLIHVLYGICIARNQLHVNSCL